MPKISVIMPAYNAEKYIGEAIDSILNQTYGDFEFIIINDGSTDKTKQIIQSYSDSRIIYLENEKNSGIVYTLNKGLDFATGEYIARMDSDDISIKHRLEKQLKTMEADLSIGVLGTGTRVFGESIKTIETHSALESEKLKAELLFSSCVCHPSVMIRKSILDNYNIRYNCNYSGAEDFEMWWRIVSVSKIASLKDILLCYRIHANQITQNYDDKYSDLMMKMLNLQLDTLNLKLTDEEKGCFLLYRLKEFKRFDSERSILFINIAFKILENNKKNKFFSQNALKLELASAIINIKNHSDMTNEEKKQCYRYAIKKNIYPNSLRIKLLLHKLMDEL